MTHDNATRTLGPSTAATLLCPNGESVARAYCDFLQQDVAATGAVSPELAGLWNAPDLARQRYWLLANKRRQTWLRIIEYADAVKPRPLRQTGWLSLEVSVQDVDALAASLAGSPFEVLRPPANLELSDNIRAAQVSGPAGEVLYLTEIKGEVPPFELSPARCAVDKLFIPVLCCHDREASAIFYENLAGQAGLRFDTKITAVNQAYGYEIGRQHPVATVQLNGDCLIEIDQIGDAMAITTAGRLPAGIAMISFEVPSLAAIDKLGWPAQLSAVPDAPYNGREVACLRGAAGEVLELIVTGTHG